jgi:hypothetical protein
MSVEKATRGESKTTESIRRLIFIMSFPHPSDRLLPR